MLHLKEQSSSSSSSSSFVYLNEPKGKYSLRVMDPMAPGLAVPKGSLFSFSFHLFILP